MSVAELQELEEVKGLITRGQQVGARGARLQGFHDVLVSRADHGRELGHGRRAVELARQARRGPLDAQRQLLQVAWRTHRPAAIAEVGINPIGWLADVRYVPSSENRSHGSKLGAKLKAFCNGTRFRYIFK